MLFRPFGKMGRRMGQESEFTIKIFNMQIDSSQYLWMNFLYNLNLFKILLLFLFQLHQGINMAIKSLCYTY